MFIFLQEVVKAMTRNNIDIASSSHFEARLRVILVNPLVLAFYWIVVGEDKSHQNPQTNKKEKEKRLETQKLQTGLGLGSRHFAISFGELDKQNKGKHFRKCLFW